MITCTRCKKEIAGEPKELHDSGISYYACSECYDYYLDGERKIDRESTLKQANWILNWRMGMTWEKAAIEDKKFQKKAETDNNMASLIRMLHQGGDESVVNLVRKYHGKPPMP